MPQKHLNTVFIISLFLLLSGEALSLPIHSLKLAQGNPNTKRLTFSKYSSHRLLAQNNRLEKGLWNAHYHDQTQKKILAQNNANSVTAQEVGFLIIGGGMDTTSAMLQISECKKRVCTFLGISKIHEPGETITSTENEWLI